MNTRLRQLLTHTHVDQTGHAVVDADQIAALIPLADRQRALLDRLTLDLARRDGITPDTLLARYQEQP